MFILDLVTIIIYYVTHLLFHVSNTHRIFRRYIITRKKIIVEIKGRVTYNRIWEVQKRRSETDASQIKAAAAPTLMPIIASNAKHISGTRMHGSGQVAYASTPRTRSCSRGMRS